MECQYTIELEYFKKSGKWYSSGIYQTEFENMCKVFNEVKQMQLEGKLPELIEGSGKEFFIYVNADHHPNGFPMLIHPLE